MNCTCTYLDGWRCARARRDVGTKSCSCDCHRLPIATAAPWTPPASIPLLLDQPVERIQPKSPFLLSLEARQTSRSRIASAPEKVVAIRGPRKPHKV